MKYASDVIKIAKNAGTIILEFYNSFNRDADVENSSRNNLNHILLPQKPDNSPVTKADMAAHHMIVSQLNSLTPNIPVVSEEDETSWKYAQSNNIFWLVDPLDGTKEFIAHNDEFTVNIALVKNGAAVFGVIFAPVLNVVYWGGNEIGAFRELNGKIESIHVSTNQITHTSPVRIVASKSHLNLQTKEFIEQFTQHTFLQVGSSLKFCRIAEGAVEIYPRLSSIYEWDTAAGQAIVEAAGGKVLQMNRESLKYGKPELVNPCFVATNSSEFLIY